ncbi:MAG: patatin family protein [Eubacterium sp.]|nr:patatin family protein [Eubacterium sp.]
MIGCIDVGGGLRDIYGAGVFDYLLDEKIYFDLCIGISAGSANCASYVARQRGRNKIFYTEYSLRKEAMSPKNIVKTGEYLDLNYIYGSLSQSDGESPLDYETLRNSETEFIVVATDAETGNPRYFNKRDDIRKNDYKIIMASSCLPFVSKPVEIYSREYFDGGISDPLPIQKALDKGCDKLVIILTKPIDTELKTMRNDVAARIIKNRYPNMVKALDTQLQKYSENLVRALELQEEGKAIIIAPDDIFGMKTLTKDVDKLTALYKKGYSDAAKIKKFLMD